jgi:uncharacterized protein (UPF0335 family)
MSSLPESAQKHLRQFVEQIERLEQDKKALSDDIRDKYLEAKAVGFDVKAMRSVISIRKKSKTEREEEESILKVYLNALGMLGDYASTPLGEHAVDEIARAYGIGKDVADKVKADMVNARKQSTTALDIISKMSPEARDRAAELVGEGEDARVAVMRGVVETEAKAKFGRVVNKDRTEVSP